MSKRSVDIVLITGEYHDDHPLSPSGMISRVLLDAGYSVGIVEKPTQDPDYKTFGEPKLFFGVTSGSIDSMLSNYTPMKRRRFPEGHPLLMPDRAVIRYCNDLRRLFKGCRIVIGGIEASLRRFAHYDYWDNDLRRSILLDSKADLLVYGNGEKQVIEAAGRAGSDDGFEGIEGTCIRSAEKPPGFSEVPSFEDVSADNAAFCSMQREFSNDKDLAQFTGGTYVLQYRYPRYSPSDLDRYFSLPFSRRLNPRSALSMARFSVVTHRGCFGGCGFCSIALHQGPRVISRSEDSIIAEIGSLTRHPDFKGYIDDLGGPSANMYGMDREEGYGCPGSIKKLDHSRAISLLRRAREVPGVKKVFVRSGIRYDIALSSEEYIREISTHHISGTLKIAPEHIDPEVLSLMRKPGSKFREFVDLFNRLNEGTGQTLRYYLMIGHPGDDVQKVRKLSYEADRLGNIEQFQLFTPTPMSLSSCIYWTGLDPITMKGVMVVRDYRTKKEMKEEMLRSIGRSRRTGRSRGTSS
ncbi:MAG: YgiQ family radical SAM protein [Candidatus Thermoplasmatota archaeon]|nr:YgiQ family radical SAM protein [Candidatus Thermoplasmatota archaeon]